jgi:hypothetical protein
MTADDTPATLLRAVRSRAWDYIVKPFPPATITDIVKKALAADGSLAIEVLSARPEWVELLVPCSLEIADRLQGFMMRLDADLPEAVRESVGYAFRELLCNAIEWGGKLDANRKVRIAYLRARRMLVYRIADPGRASRWMASRTRPSTTHRTGRSTIWPSGREWAFEPAASASSWCEHGR